MTTRRVMIVDDEKDLLDMIASAFKDKGIIVEVFDNPGFAESRLHKETFDALITDLKMPYLDGINLIKSARSSQHNRKMPTFLISAYLDKSAVARLNAIGGVQGVFVKPFEVTALVAKVVEAFPNNAK